MAYGDTDPDASGSWTYSETVARGHYDVNHGGLFGKHDNVRTYWEDEVTRLALRPFVRERMVACAAANRRVRILDLGCGSGQGHELLTRIRQSELSLEEPQRHVLSSEQIELYLGLDISESMVEQGRRNYEHTSYVRFEQADLREGLGVAARERPFDIYFSSYGSLSHLSLQELKTCLRAVVRHAAPGALVVLDLMGRFSLEWPGYWLAQTEEEKVRPYSMSYLFPEHERQSGEIERFPLRFWTGHEIKLLCEDVSGETGVPLEVLELVDRSIFVGRHIDTGEYGSDLPPLRRLVNRLYEQNTRTQLDRMLVRPRPVPGALGLNEFFQSMASCWNTVVEFARTRLSGTRVDLVEMSGWRDFPPALQMALVTVDRIVDSVAWMDVGDVRANVIEPQLAYALRRMQHRLQDGRGCGHGLLAAVRVGPSSASAPAVQ